MGEKVQVRAELDAEWYADLERLAAHFGCSVEHMATTALLRFIGEESRVFPSEFDGIPPYEDPDPLARDLREAEASVAKAWKAYLDPRLEAADRAIDRGEFISQEDMEAWFEARRLRDAAE